jgi:monoamine oxidase
MPTDTNTTSRRRFIAGGLAAGAAVAVPAAADAKKRKKKHKTKHHTIPTRTADVVVIGGGFAGLTAARRLTQRHKSVIVLEARDRVGGRVWNHNLGGGVVSERGGTFVGPTQDRVLALAKEFGIGTFPTYDTGKDIYINGSTRLEYDDTNPLTGNAPPDPLALPNLATIVMEMDNLSKSVPVGAPWTAAKAHEWDTQTLESWINAHIAVTPQFKALLPVATRPIFGAEPHELSLLFVLFYIASSGNAQNPGTFERNFNTRGGGQQDRFFGGSQQIAIHAAHQLGKRVVLSSPARTIEQHKGTVTVHSDKLIVKAKHAIVAMPPVLAGRIHYPSGLPSGRHQLTDRFPQGTLTKVAAVYDTPFWRNEGFTGQALSTAGPVSATFDDSPPSGKPGIVFGFVGGDEARKYNASSPAARKAAVLNQFKGFFGAQALRPRAFFDTIWTQEQWTRGCPVGIPTLGTLSALGPHLRQPVGHIHWAGTETSDYWNGYMDGAVRSGERAASEVLAEL